jgi:hypothetical protein
MVASSSSFAGETSPCTYTVSQSFYYFQYSPVTGTIAVQTGTGCAWTVTADSEIQIYAGASGIGPGTFSFFGLLSRYGHSITVGNGTVGATVIVVPGGVANAPDLTGDGVANVIWQAPSGGDAQVWAVLPFNGPAAIARIMPLHAESGWNIAGAEDVDLDGFSDLVWQQPSTGTTQVWYMQNGHISSAANITSGNTWRMASVRGTWCCRAQAIWQDPQTGTAQAVIIPYLLGSALSGPNSWRIAGAADFDNDGWVDVVWQDPQTGQSQIWYGPPSSLTAVPLSGPNPWRIAALVDIDREGHVDVIWQDPQTGASQVWYMGGLRGIEILSAATFTSPNPWRIVGPR